MKSYINLANKAEQLLDRGIKKGFCGFSAVLLLFFVVIAIGLSIGFGILYLIYLGIGYVTAILSPVLATKLAELGFWGFVILFFLVKWVLNVIAKPFKTKVEKEDD